MKKRFILFLVGLFVFGMALGGLTLLLRPDERALILPEATNDTMFAVVGGAENTQGSIEAHTTQESYPVGTAELVLEITNHNPSALTYNGWYDFRRLENDEWISLTPRADVLFDQSEQLLGAGETASQTIPIDLFDPPLAAGTYRLAQLACYTDTGGNALACTEITSEFVLTA